jgi:hypothetical protein
MGNLSRRSFLKGAGLATGAAIVGASPIAAAAAEDAPELVASPSPLPREPLVAYVRDAHRSEVTVLLGTEEVTYRDRGLTKRLLKAARHHKPGAGEVA